MNFILNNIFLIGVIIACTVLLLLPIVQGRGPHHSVYTVTQNMNKQRHVFVDIRSEEEFNKAHVRNAVHIPAAELKDKMGRIERFKNEAVVVVCGNGKQSHRVTAQLKKAGFGNVCSIEGGMKAWVDDGMPTESGAEGDKSKKKGKA